MALVVLTPLSTTDQKRRSTSFRATTTDNKKPPSSLLKDYLLDDLSSCSSSGFRSFPRRTQCCAAAATLVLQNSISSNPRSSSSKRFLNNKTTHQSKSKLSSALHRASVAVINAVKLLPFKQTTTTTTKLTASITTAKKKKTDKSKSFKRSILPKGLSSRWLFRRSSSCKSNSGRPAPDDGDEPRTSSGDNRIEIERWITSTGEEKYVPSDLSNTTMTTVTMTTTSSASTTTSANSDRWSESDDHSEFGPSGSSKSNSGENGVVFGIKGGETGRSDDSLQTHDKFKKNWVNQLELEEKEQLSPVSVLNYPDYDHEQTPSSPFIHGRLKTLNGTRKRLIQKLLRFDRLSNLDPINLDSRLQLAAAEPTADESSSIEENTTLPSNLPSTSPPSSPPPEEAKETTELVKDCNARSSALLFSEEEVLRESGGWQLSYRTRQQDQYLMSKRKKGGGGIMIEQECSVDGEKDEVAMGAEVGILSALIDELLKDMLGLGRV